MEKLEAEFLAIYHYNIHPINLTLVVSMLTTLKECEIFVCVHVKSWTTFDFDFFICRQERLEQLARRFARKVRILQKFE